MELRLFSGKTHFDGSNGHGAGDSDGDGIAGNTEGGQND